MKTDPHAIFSSTSCAFLYCSTSDRGDRSYADYIGRIGDRKVKLVGIDLDSPLEAHCLSCSHNVGSDNGLIVDCKIGTISESLVKDRVVSVLVRNSN